MSDKAEEMKRDLSPGDVSDLADPNCPDCNENEIPGVHHKHGDTSSLCWVYCDCVRAKLDEAAEIERERKREQG